MTIETPNADTSNANGTDNVSSNISGNNDNLGTSNEETNSPSWWIDEGVPGPGERPEWLGEKFKSMSDMATSYRELEKRVGVAPENYDFTQSRYMDADFEGFHELQEIAKEKRVPKEVVDKMIDSFDRYMDSFGYDHKEETQKLGKDADKRLGVLNNWAKANLSDKSYSALTRSLNSADAILALEELRGNMMNNSTQIPGSNDTTGNEEQTLADIQHEMTTNLQKYKDDPKYRRELQGRIERLANKGDYVDKHY